MATKTLTSAVVIDINTVVVNSVNTPFKLIDLVYVESTVSWMFILQKGVIRDNKFNPGSTFLVKTSTQIRDEFMQVWEADRVVVRKGDVFKDNYGDVYFAETDKKVWNLNKGTWSAPRTDGDTVKWDGNVLTPMTTVSGHAFSKYLG